MTITVAEVAHIAHLSRLDMNDTELSNYQEELNTILNLVEQMNQIDTTMVPPLSNPLNTVQRLRSDAVTENDVREHMQLLAPEVSEGLYLVPKVIDEPKEIDEE